MVVVAVVAVMVVVVLTPRVFWHLSRRSQGECGHNEAGQAEDEERVATETGGDGREGDVVQRETGTGLHSVAIRLPTTTTTTTTAISSTSTVREIRSKARLLIIAATPHYQLV